MRTLSDESRQNKAAAGSGEARRARTCPESLIDLQHCSVHRLCRDSLNSLEAEMRIYLFLELQCLQVIKPLVQGWGVHL